MTTDHEALREALILTLGQSDMQPWDSLADAPSMGEHMYGKQADALLDGPLTEMLAERDRLQATLDTVRKLADKWADPNAATFVSGPQSIFGASLRRILDAADGGDWDE